MLYIYSRCSTNSEALPSECLNNIEEMWHTDSFYALLKTLYDITINICNSVIIFNPLKTGDCCDSHDLLYTANEAFPQGIFPVTTYILICAPGLFFYHTMMCYPLRQSYDLYHAIFCLEAWQIQLLKTSPLYYSTKLKCGVHINNVNLLELFNYSDNCSPKTIT